MTEAGFRKKTQWYYMQAICFCTALSVWDFFIPGGHSEVNSDVSLYIGSGVLSTFSIIQWKEETSALV